MPNPLYLPNIPLNYSQQLLISEWICFRCQQSFTAADLQSKNYVFLITEPAHLAKYVFTTTLNLIIETITHQHCPLPQGFTRQSKCLNKS
jgi:hypothetical protein